MDVMQHSGKVIEDRERQPGSADVLLSRWRSGDPKAFREVVDRFQGPLLVYVFSILRHLQDAEDVVQETFMRANAAVQHLREPASLWGWLKRIAHNVAVDAARKSRRSGTPTDPSVIMDIGASIAEEAGSPDTGLSLEAIVTAIQTLPETYREAAVYHYLEEWPSLKIAATLGIAAAAARQRISRAGKILRSALRHYKDSENNDM